MNNPLKNSKTMSDQLIDTVSEMSQKNISKAAVSGKAAMDKGLVTAKQLRKSRVVNMVERNPVKTIGALAALGLIAYSIFGSKKGQSRKVNQE